MIRVSPENRFNIFLLVVVALFFCLGAYKLALPGLNADELYFAEFTAFGLAPGGKLPLFPISYMGALKTWIYLPIHQGWGLNPFTIRLPMMMLTAISLTIFGTFLKRAFSSRTAAAIILLMVLNPTFFQGSRLDIGEVSLYFFLLSLALFWLREYLDSTKPVAWVILLIVLFAGGFHRINFFWFSLPLIFSAAFLFSTKRKALSALGLFVFCEMIFLLWRSKIPVGQELFFSAGARTVSLFATLNGYLSGAAFADLVYVPAYTREVFRWGATKTIGLFLAYPIGLAAFFLLRFFHKKPVDSSWSILFFLTSIGAATGYFSADRAHNYWHIFPIWLCLIVGLVASADRWLGSEKKLNEIWFAAILLPFFLTYSAEAIRFRSLSKDTDPSPSFSDAIYPLIDFCAGEKTRCVDVGARVYQQLMATMPLDRLPEKFRFFSLHNVERMRPEALLFLNRENLTFVVLDHGFDGKPTHGDFFLDFAEEEGFRQKTNEAIRDSRGRVVYQVVQFEKALKAIPGKHP